MLKNLDNHYCEYDFAYFENANFDYVKSRTDILVDGKHWLLMIQCVGVSEIGPEICVYYFSDLLENGADFQTYETIQFPSYQADTDEEIPEQLLLEGEVSINHNDFVYSYTKENYASHDIDLKDPSSIFTYILRLLSADPHISSKMCIPLEELLSDIEIPGEWKLLLSTEDWQHTEVEDKPPSENPFFESVAKAMEENDSSLITLGAVNTHWSNWVDYDFDKQADWELFDDEED